MDSLLQKCLGGENLRMMSEGGASLSKAGDDVDHAGREAHLQGEGSQGKSGQGGLKIRDVKTGVFWKRLKRYTCSKMRLQNVLSNFPFGFLVYTIFW